MRSTRTIMMVLACVLGVAAVAPTVASASNWKTGGLELRESVHWTRNQNPLPGNSSVAFEGPITLSSESLGGVTCDATAGVILKPGKEGYVSTFEASASSCSLSGNLKAVCTGGVTTISAGNLPWSVAAMPDPHAIAINGITVTVGLKGGLVCPKVVSYSGSLKAVPDSSDEMRSVTLSGSLSAKNGSGQSLGAVAASGTQNVAPAGEYGIADSDSVVSLKGNLGWVSESEGSMNCPVSGSLRLEAGSEGKITSLAWNASECASGGAFALCGAVTSVTSDALPWTVVDEGSAIRIPKLSLTIHLKSSLYCGTVQSVEGEMLLTPNSSAAIGSTTLSGTTLTGGSPKSWGGALNWTPAGVYGLL